jgi:tetratricopeptide (TPR) repeat protein
MPGDRQVFHAAINAADRYRWDSQWAEAAYEYQRALAEFPDDATARSGLGFCYMQTKQWQQALEQYEHTLKRDLSNVIALSKTAELYGILGRRDDAYRAYLHLADLYSQAGQGARAEAAWQKAVQLSPGNPEPHERLASYYFEKKDIASMVQERLAAAQGYLLRHEMGLARVQCEEALRADAGNIEAQQLLTRILEGNSPITRGGRETPYPGSGAGSTEQRGHRSAAGTTSDPMAFTGDPLAISGPAGNISGGNTGIMGNMSSAGNFGGAGNPGPPLTNGSGSGNAPRKRITASQVTSILKQAQAFQAQGRFNDAIDLCEQILESGFDRPDAQYFLGWLYQEQHRWDDAIARFQKLLNDPDYALSCYYALGQCYRARGDLRTATVHFDEAVDRVNLDALTLEEADQLVQLCQEAAEAHRSLGEQEQALTVYNALLGFLRSRGWNDKVAQVEFMLHQAQNAPVPPLRPSSPSPYVQATQTSLANQQTMAPAAPPSIPEAPTMAFNAANMGTMAGGPGSQQTIPPVTPVQPATGTSPVGELPEWLTGILSDADKTQIANKPAGQPPIVPVSSPVADQPTVEQRIPPAINCADTKAAATNAAAAPSWLVEDVKPVNTTPVQPPEPVAPAQPVQPAATVPPASAAQPAPASQQTVLAAQAPAAQPEPTVQAVSSQPAQPVQPPAAPEAPAPAMQPANAAVPAAQPVVPTEPASPTPAAPVVQAVSSTADEAVLLTIPALSTGSKTSNAARAEDLLAQIAGRRAQDSALLQVADAVLASTANLPEQVRLQVVRSMQDIQNYINHGLLNSATEECLRVIDMAPQYLDVHQVLCEIYVRQGQITQAVTKYGILVDTYIVNGRIEDAVAIYRRILQLEPNNLTYRTRLIDLLSTQGYKEDLLHERTLAAEAYLRLGYMDRALTELEQALQESPTSVPSRLNYALALQKLGRIQQAVAEYQRVLQVDPRNLTALVRWHIAMITRIGAPRANTLEVLTRIRWLLRGEGQKHYEAVSREYNQAAEAHPHNGDVHFALGQFHQQAALYDKAIDEYDLAMRDRDIEVLARMSQAQCFFSQGKPEAAINQLEQVLQIVRRSPAAMDPTIWAARPREEGEEHQAPEVEILLQLAKAYERTGRIEQKETILRQVKQTRTGEDEVASAMAEISARQSDLDSAMREYLELVRHYRNKRQTDNALNVLNEMVRLAPQDPRAHNELADIYLKRGLLDEGIAELRLLADIYLRQNRLEEAAEAIQRIGNIYADADNEEGALTNLKRAAELNPRSMELLREVVSYCWRLGHQQDAASYQSIIARHYFDTRQVKESVAALQQLIAIDRNNYEAYDMLGQTYQSVGEYEQASRVYRNLAKVHPDSPIARERLATLQELRTK